MIYCTNIKYSISFTLNYQLSFKNFAVDSLNCIPFRHNNSNKSNVIMYNKATIQNEFSEKFKIKLGKFPFYFWE